jgi:hypothetical protein
MLKVERANAVETITALPRLRHAAQYVREALKAA